MLTTSINRIKCYFKYQWTSVCSFLSKFLFYRVKLQWESSNVFWNKLSLHQIQTIPKSYKQHFWHWNPWHSALTTLNDVFIFCSPRNLNRKKTDLEISEITILSKLSLKMCLFKYIKSTIAVNLFRERHKTIYSSLMSETYFPTELPKAAD